MRWDMLSSLPVAGTKFADVRETNCKKCPHSLITISVLPIVPTECLANERLATDSASTTRKKKMMSSVLRSILRDVH